MTTPATAITITGITPTTIMADASAPAIALPIELLIWLSPAFPVGAFAFSHGLEMAVERGWVTTRHALEDWLADVVEHGSLRTDVILLAAAWRAAESADGEALRQANDWACALQPSAERHLETVTQGASFVAAIRAAWPAPRLDLMPEEHIAYPVAVGAVAALHGMPLEATALAYGVAFVSNFASAAIRLGVIGHSDGQRVVAVLLPKLQALAYRSCHLTLDEIGSATLRADLASLFHETQYSRLFRS
jgi:urease accessory protein